MARGRARGAPALLRRVRWGNVGRLAAVLAAGFLIALAPRGCGRGRPAEGPTGPPGAKPLPPLGETPLQAPPARGAPPHDDRPRRAPGRERVPERRSSHAGPTHGRRAPRAGAYVPGPTPPSGDTPAVRRRYAPRTTAGGSGKLAPPTAGEFTPDPGP